MTTGGVHVGFDGITLRAVITQLQDVIGAKVQKVYETRPGRDLILHLYGSRKTSRLLLSADRQGARLHLTRRRYAHPDKPSNFCMALRKHLTSAVITAVSQVDLDRIARVRIHSYDDLGSTRHLGLVIEAMGRHSNILLLDEDADDRIITARRFASADRNPHRTVLPGHPYRLPPAKNAIPLADVDTDTLLDRAGAAGGSAPAWLWLVRTVQGPGPEEARRILRRVRIDPRADVPADPGAVGALCDELRRCARVVSGKDWRPYMVLQGDPGSRLPDVSEYGVIPDRGGCRQDRRRMRSISALLDAVYALQETKATMRQMKEGLTRDLGSALESAERKLRKQREDVAGARDAERIRQFGELLTTYMHQVRPGTSEVTLPNYYDEGNPVSIPLDPRRSPSRNAADYFRRYRKAQRTGEIGRRRLRETQQELRYLQSLLDTVDRTETLGDLRETREEAKRAGYIRGTQDAPGADRRPTQRRKPYRIYETPSGARVYVGRNNAGNDHLVTRVASRDDLWFHVQDLAGSHVLLRAAENDTPDDATLEEVAVVAAYHSTARHSSNVPVDYTRIKNVTKPRGARPGMVTYREHRTVYVTPPEDLAEYTELRP